MKKVILFILILISGNAIAQEEAKKIIVTPTVKNLGGGTNPCLEVVIYECNPDHIEKAFRTWMKDYDASVNGTKEGVFADNALIKELGSRAVDIYLRVDKWGVSDSKILIAFDLGGKFINETDFPKEHEIMKGLVYNFSLAQYKAGLERLIKAETKAEEKLESQKSGFEKDMDGLKKDIVKYKEKIKMAEDNIELDKKKIEEKKIAIEAQKKKLLELEERLKTAK